MTVTVTVSSGQNSDPLLLVGLIATVVATFALSSLTGPANALTRSGSDTTRYSWPILSRLKRSWRRVR